jgi:hypothetical protein
MERLPRYIQMANASGDVSLLADGEFGAKITACLIRLSWEAFELSICTQPPRRSSSRGWSIEAV